MNIVGYRKLWYAISALLILPGIIALFLWGLKPGIDFKGGTILELKFAQNPSVEQIKTSLDELKLDNLSIQETSENSFLIKPVKGNSNNLRRV